jgi:FO synthase
MGGVLMNESITRAAGAVHGQEIGAGDMERIILACGREPRQRTTLYGAARRRASPAAPSDLFLAGGGGST